MERNPNLRVGRAEILHTTAALMDIQTLAIAVVADAICAAATKHFCCIKLRHLCLHIS